MIPLKIKLDRKKWIRSSSLINHW